MRLERGDDVGEAVAVDVVGVHLGAAFAEVDGVEGPLGVVSEARGLLPPAACFEQVDAAVAVDVAVAETVRETLEARVGLLGDLVEGPLPRGLGPVWLAPAEDAVLTGDQL